MTAASELFALQEIDLSIANDRAAIADIESRLDEPEELVAARQLLQQRKEEQRQAEHAFKEHEFEADEQKRKIEPLEKKLYDGVGLTAKELSDLQADVESLKRRRSQLEDQALEAMEALEEAQRALAEADAEVGRLADQYGVEREDLGARRTELEEDVARLEQQRAEEASEIEGGLLALYERLRESKGGRAVAKIVGGACQGCRISLPMNIQQRARAGQTLVQCPSCERILYMI